MNLVEEIRAGNSEAKKQVFDEYSLSVYNFALEITGSHEKALASVKSAFTQVYDRIANGENPENLRLFILKCTHESAFAMILDSYSFNSIYSKEETESISESEEDVSSDEASLTAETANDTTSSYKKSPLVVILIIVGIILILVLVWFVVGLLENMNIIPSVDLGYSWFNDYICPLFYL